MKKELSMLFYKLKKSRIFWILLVLSAILMNVYLFLKNYALDGLSTGAVEAIPSTYGTIWIYMILFTSHFVGDEFSSNTMKNIVASGANRKKIYLSYWMVTVGVMLLYYMIQTGTGLLIGAFLTRNSLYGSVQTDQLIINAVAGVIVLLVISTTMVAFHFATQKGGTSFGFALLLLEGIMIPVLRVMSTVAQYFSIAFYADVWLQIEPSRLPPMIAFLLLVGFLAVVGIAGMFSFSVEDIDG